MLPPIRYPLPSFLALTMAALLTWQAVELSKGWRAEMASRLKLKLEGPPVPRSPRPRVIAGPLTSRALLLRDETIVANRPDGSMAETIDRRMFVDVYDTWPNPGPISHIRIGNRNKAIGWVKVGDVLPWDTRLVVRAPEGRLDLADSPESATQPVEVGNFALPVISWTDRAVEVAVWDPAHPWSTVARRGWIPLDRLPPESWGVWISQVELPVLLGSASRGETPLLVRLRAVLGRLADNRPWVPADLDLARPALPPLVFDRGPDARGSAGRLAEANARTAQEAGWSGLSFRFLPLGDLP